MTREKIATRQKVAGVILQCPICGHNDFWTRKTQLNKAGVTLISFERSSQAADNYVCDSCGFVLWFLQKK
jgi:hypothetical protein